MKKTLKTNNLNDLHTPPTPEEENQVLKPVNVKDLKTAKALMTRLIRLAQQNKISQDKGKYLSYLIQVFIQVCKAEQSDVISLKRNDEIIIEVRKPLEMISDEN